MGRACRRRSTNCARWFAALEERTARIPDEGEEKRGPTPASPTAQLICGPPLAVEHVYRHVYIKSCRICHARIIVRCALSACTTGTHLCAPLHRSFTLGRAQNKRDLIEAANLTRSCVSYTRPSAGSASSLSETCDTISYVCLLEVWCHDITAHCLLWFFRDNKH